MIILCLVFIVFVIMMMTFPGFLKKPYAPLCDNFCSDKKT